VGGVRVAGAAGGRAGGDGRRHRGAWREPEGCWRIGGGGAGAVRAPFLGEAVAELPPRCAP
jgi:hypothetical protein